MTYNVFGGTLNLALSITTEIPESIGVDLTGILGYAWRDFL